MHWQDFKEISAGRWMLAFVMGTLGLLAVLYKLEFPQTWWLQAHDLDKPDTLVARPWAPWLGNGTALVAAVAAFGAPLRGGVLKNRDRRELEDLSRLHDAEKQLSRFANIAFASTVSRETDPARAVELFQKLTVRIYCIDRRSDPVHLRAVAQTSNHERVPSGINWVLGKGLVGVTWRDQQHLFLNTEGPKYLAALANEQAWGQADHGLRQGLTYAEATRVAGHGFGSLATWPVADSNGIYGVLAVDAPPGHVGLVNDDTFKRLIEHVARSTAKELRTVWETYDR